MEKKRYDALDGVRTYSILGIVMMHVLANGKFNTSGFVFKSMIPSFTNLVFLFMAVSGLGMCCGYYDRFKNKNIDITTFYKRRYEKLLPFFAVLCCLDFIVSPSRDALYELFADITMCFGLLPNANIGVVGVGWTLGVIFVFYLLFPFFCFLMENKKKAWMTFAIALIFNYLCNIYFFDENHVISSFSNRTSIIYCFVYFTLGGILFLYRDKISDLPEKAKYLVATLIVVAIIVYYKIGTSTISILFVDATILLYCMLIFKKGLLINKFTNKFGSISFEIYLSHMFIYKVIEKAHITKLTGNDYLNYGYTLILTLIGAIIFSVILKKIIKVVTDKISN